MKAFPKERKPCICPSGHRGVADQNFLSKKKPMISGGLLIRCQPLILLEAIMSLSKKNIYEFEQVIYEFEHKVFYEFEHLF